MFRSLLIAAAREGRQKARRHFSAATGNVSAGIVARKAAVLFPSAALGFYAAISDESKAVAFTVNVLPARLGRDLLCASKIVFGTRSLQLHSFKIYIQSQCCTGI